MPEQRNNLVFVDVEATGDTPFSGEMTEFGAVHYNTRETYHGVLFGSEPGHVNPAKPVITGAAYPQEPVMQGFADWLAGFDGRPIFVSDNPAYDFMWIAYYFDKTLGHNPFGHSGRRISDFWAGFQNDWRNTQRWKNFRRTPHDHNPVNDAMGNVEAFTTIMAMVDRRNDTTPATETVGVPTTPEIQALADEAEQGYDPATIGPNRLVCARCGKRAANEVHLINRRTRAAISTEILCADHVQVEITLASTPDLGQQDIHILPLRPTP